MKIFTIAIIYLLSFKNIINKCQSDDDVDSSASKSSCTSRIFSEKEKEYDYYKCCYVKAKCPNILSGGTTETKQCEGVTKNEYDNIKAYADTAKNLGCKDVKIQCKSSYLKLALIYFILIIL